MGVLRKGYHLSGSPLPSGWRIFNDDLDVAGLHFRKSAASKFVIGKAHALSFEPEPSNKHDGNAVRILGTSKGWFGTRSRHVGYADADIAGAIADAALIQVVVPRLKKTFLSTDGFVEIVYQLIGPKDRYSDWLEVRPT